MKPTLSVLALSLIAACSASSEEASVERDARVRQISLDLKELFRIGGDDSGVMFGNIMQIAADTSGRLYVADPQVSSVKVFSNSGELITTFGGRGRGPGEFMQIHNVHVDQRGRVYVWDYQLRRVSVYEERSRDAFELVQSLYVEGHNRQQPYLLVGAAPEGILMAYHIPFRICTDCPPGDEAIAYENLMLVNTNGIAIGEPLATLPSPRVIAAGRAISQMPFGKNPVFTMSPAGHVYAGWPKDINITARSIDGNWQKSIRHDYVPISITESERRAVYAIEFRNERLRTAVRKADLPDSWPAYTSFTVDDKDRVWIALSTRGDAPAREYLVLDSGGTELGILELPRRFRLMVVRNGRAIGILTGRNSGPLVVAYAVSE